MLEALLLGLTLGATSAVHCVAMCGPLTAFVAIGPDAATDPMRVARYQAGRAIGYGTLGGVAGGIGGALAGVVPSWTHAVLSVTLGVSLGVAAFQLWPRTPHAPLTSLRAGPRAPTWRERVSRASAGLLAHARRSPLGLGVASALLPCGVLAAGALLAASTGHVATGMAAMLGVALASGAAVAIAGFALGRVQLQRSAVLARAMAVTLAIGAVLLCVRPALVSPEAPESCHAH